MELKSVSSPAVTTAGLRRLYAFARPRKLTKESTLFEAGYEQAKADLMEKLRAEAILPDTGEKPKASTTDPVPGIIERYFGWR